MDYELCKQLKEAGFPQTTEFYFIDNGSRAERKDTWEMVEGEWGFCRRIDGDKLDCVAAPTLSELIDACPRTIKLSELRYSAFTLEAWPDNGWHAGYPIYDGVYKAQEGEGKTPEEAVARLYLSLQEKQLKPNHHD